MKKRLKFIIPVIILAGILSIVFLVNKKNNIPNNYIAVFHGGVGEITHETYIYKVDNGQPNHWFYYINVESTTVSWGSSDWKHKISKKGYFTWTDEAFSIAKANGAYSYVTLPNDDKIYTIEEFQNRFIAIPSAFSPVSRL